MSIHLLDLRTRHVAMLPGSAGLWSPRWSPDGRYILAAMKSVSLVLYDWKSQEWTDLPRIEGNIAFTTWSRDSRYIYVDTVDNDPAIFRLRIKDAKIERIVSLRDVPRTDGWAGLAPDDSPLIDRDAGTQEVYALDMQWP